MMFRTGSTKNYGKRGFGSEQTELTFLSTSHDDEALDLMISAYKSGILSYAAGL